MPAPHPQACGPCRHATQLSLRRAQLTYRRETIHTEEGRVYASTYTEDDVLRMYGVLLAFSKFGDQLQLFASIVLRNKWLHRRAGQGWLETKLRFLNL